MEIIIRNLQKKIPINPKRIKQAVLKAFSLENIKKSGELTICFVNDTTIRELNLLYLGQDRPTDVIAFDLSENKTEVFADLAVSTDTAVRQARIFKTSPAYEVYLYVVHGVLHLLGYDDQAARQKKIMDKKALHILSELNIPEPKPKPKP